MNTKLPIKQWAVTSAVVFLIIRLVTFIIKRWLQPLLIPVTAGGGDIIPVLLSTRFLLYAASFISACLFTFLYSQMNDAKKTEMRYGALFGLWIGLLLFLPDFVVGLIYSPVPAMAQIIFVFVRVVQYVLCGIVTAYLHKLVHAVPE